MKPTTATICTYDGRNQIHLCRVRRRLHLFALELHPPLNWPTAEPTNVDDGLCEDVDDGRNSLTIGISQLGQLRFTDALSTTQFCNVDPFKSLASELERPGPYGYQSVASQREGSM